MKKYSIYLSGLLVGILILSSCTKDFLEVKPKGTTLETNYYKNASEAFNGLVAAYDPLGSEVAAGAYGDKVGMLNSASDDCYAGGGDISDVPGWQAWNSYTLDAGSGPQAQFWSRNYTGINRVNTLLSKLDGVPMDAALKARYKAEAKFLRAYYYFDLVRLFKNIPLFTDLIPTADIFSVKQAKPEEVWAQIEKDLTDAIPDLPVTVSAAEGGRVTKMAAVAYLGKVILTQNDETRMLEAADLFEQVNTSPSYGLLPNFGDIFLVDNKFNKESIFEISHTSVANDNWNNFNTISEGNVYIQMVGPNGYVGPTYKEGWGFNPLTLSLVNALKTDPRYKYTVANIDSLKQAGVASYTARYQNTGYFIQKYAPLVANYSTHGGDAVINWPNNTIELRLADTYLMEAEALVRGGGDLGKAKYYLDQVRGRVGLGSIPPTLDNIYNERRLELATEGHRYFDLIRTGKAATVLAFKGFTAGKNELLPIPLTELANTKLVQNPNY